MPGIVPPDSTEVNFDPHGHVVKYPEIKIVGYQGFAELVGLSPRTLSTYAQRGLLPEPDRVVDNKPLWFSETANEWNDARKQAA